MTEKIDEAKKKSPRRWLLAAGCLVPVLLVAGVIGLVWYRLHQLRGDSPDEADIAAMGNMEGVELSGRIVPWASPPYGYDGPGRLDAYMPQGCTAGEFRPNPTTGQTIGGKAVNCRPGIVSKLVPSPRVVLVHLPAGYDPQGPPLPVVVAFHGFGQRPHHVARALISAFDDALAAGALAPVVLVMPDVSLSGNGLDDPKTPWEDVGGSWGVNSNLGRFADFLRDELLPWIAEHYRVRTDPAGTILLGGSMGGTIALNMMLDNPRRFPNVGAFYPGLDLRYACHGSRIAPYDPNCYQPIVSDDPDRPMVTGRAQAYLFSERFLLYPVFDSDRWKGPVWREDMPVWRRVQANNPMDRLRDARPDLHGVTFWYVAGDHDDFNINSEAPRFNALARELGAEIEPAENIRPGRHDIPFIQENLPDAIAWITKRLVAR